MNDVIINWTKHQTEPQNLSKKRHITTHLSPSKVPEIYPLTTQILEQLSSQCIPSSQWLICSWVAAGAHPVGERAHSRRIHNVIVLALQSHILISNNALFKISQEIKSTVSDVLNVSLLPDNPSLKLPIELLETCFLFWEVSWIWALSLSIIIWFLPISSINSRLEVGGGHPEEGSCVHHAQASGCEMCCWLVGYYKWPKTVLGCSISSQPLPFWQQ